MNMAMICLGYMPNPSGAALLAEYFDGIADFYLHVDAKSEIAPYAQAAARQANITLAETRYPIFWGGFNTVRACVAAIEQALRAKSYDRIGFITEDTIPLIAKSDFLTRMSGPTEWIQIYPTSDPTWLARYEQFFYFDSFATNPRTVERLARAWTPEMVSDIQRLDALQRRGKARPATLFDGGTWWCLTRPHIDTFLSSYHTDAHLRESFEFSAIPEEQYIHTVIGPLAQTRALVFTDWTREPRPYVFRSMDAIRSAKSGDTPMLRKVAVGVPEIEQFVRDLASR